jgi:hypothetical protein
MEATMGVIFKREVPVESVTDAIATNLRGHLEAALREPPPGTAAEATARAEVLAQPAAQAAAKVAAQPGAKVSIQTMPFLIAFGLFFLLLAIAIFLDWKNVVDDPKVYSGMVTTVLGAVIGFLGGDAAGTASSS